ncbi:hypothetical protein BDY19DRAFT_888033 [Irpex rosettiformis]|uniref:Uncharacterized protein n=1 Tax=Irpex rosettiformis TaxID=378272 RepID=A0ACB8U7Y0_9APHY|nr:hypothetical protein BDY19DRAFT_888033 [Irpex rosettiformis]
MSAGRGMPLLSGPPPQAAEHEGSCRKCNKEFNMLFARSRRCNHCGYSYCHSCSDYQALMPRNDNSGYDTMPICAYCVESLNSKHGRLKLDLFELDTFTAAGKGQLRGLSLAKLKKYASDYGINVRSVVEKDDLIDRLINARAPNGCLPPQLEAYYRRHGIPERSSERPRGILSRAMEAMNAEYQPPPGSSQQNPQRAQTQTQARARTTSQPSFPRPDLQSDLPHPPPRSPPPPGSPYYNMNTPHPSAQQTNAQNTPRPGMQTPRPSAGTPRSNTPHFNVPPTNPRSRSTSVPRPPTDTPSATPPFRPSLPSLDELLAMSPDDVRALPISTLKAVLFQNHVNARMIVEKSELVSKVQTLINDERAEREAHARREAEEDRELQEALEASRREHAERERERQQPQGPDQAASSASDDVPIQDPLRSSSPSSASKEETPRQKMSARPQNMASHLERTGLCVICQDEEANIAIVDCGHLCMCRVCSELIMNETRECPLCRTRIVTDARLLRIFKS